MAISEKEKFTLTLQGYENGGHMIFWSVLDGELAGIVNDEYTMVTRNWDGNTNRVVGNGRYYTLGKKIEHKEMVKKWMQIPFADWKTKDGRKR